MLASVLTGFGSAGAIAPPELAQAASRRTRARRDNEFTGVTVLSPRNARAVGFFSNSGGHQTLIEHWNGSSCASCRAPIRNERQDPQQRPRPLTARYLGGSLLLHGTSDSTLVLHYDGKLGSDREPEPWHVCRPERRAPGLQDRGLAVGDDTHGGGDRTLILRLKGGRWTQVEGPDPGSDNALFGVTASSVGNAWRSATTPAAVKRSP